MSDNTGMATATLQPINPSALCTRPAPVESDPTLRFDRLVALASPDLGRRIVEAARLAVAAHQLLNARDEEEAGALP